MKRMIILGALVVALFACDDSDDDVFDEDVTLTYEFESNAEGWTADFADYPVGEDDRFELEFEQTYLPAPLDESEGAIGISGTNLSDDLFMFIKKQVDGLEPNTMYQATFEVQFASNVPEGTAGIGGSPGSSVWIKAGAVQNEPVPEQEDNAGVMYYRMNIDKGGQSQGGSDMHVLGDFSNETDRDQYALKTVASETPIAVTTDSNGQLWLIVGTDSGFEGNTTIYYNTITVRLES